MINGGNIGSKAIKIVSCDCFFIIQQLNQHSPCLCGPYASLLDEIHYWHDSGHSDRLFNHPSSTTKPFSPGKDRQRLELIPECVAWVTLWYVLALALYIKILDMEIRYLSISLCNHVHILDLGCGGQPWSVCHPCSSAAPQGQDSSSNSHLALLCSLKDDYRYLRWWFLCSIWWFYI